MTTISADRPRASVFIATSVDGFIARPDDGLDWLTGTPDDELTGEHDPDQDFGYGEFFASVDALLMGRGTFDVVSRLVADVIGHVYVDGGKVIRQFLAAGLIDRMTISTPPVLIGEGIPLFGGTGSDIRLDLLSCETFDGGMVQRVYDVVR